MCNKIQVPDIYSENDLVYTVKCMGLGPMNPL